MPTVGDMAPDFTLRNTHGDEIQLSERRGQARVVLIFYPGDQTTGWTKQLVAVRDAYDQFRALDAEIYGVNPADAASHQAFIDAYDFPFDLLIDDGLAVSRAYDALRPEGDRIQRTVVIIDRNGRILFFQRGAPPPPELLAAITGANDGAGG